MSLYRLNKATIKLFKAVVLKNGKQVAPEKEQEYQVEAIKHGVVIDPEAFVGRSLSEAREIVDDAIAEYGVDMLKVNSTFYKRFSDVEERSTLELRLDQLTHYMSTYGRGIGRNDIVGYEPEQLAWLDIKVADDLAYIEALPAGELADKVKNMLTSGMALSEEVQSHLLVIINGCKLPVSGYLDQISNREFMCRMCKELELLPKNFDEFTRYLIYLGTGSTMLIKSRVVLNSLDHLDDDQWFDDASHYAPLERAFDQYVRAFGIEQVAKNITRYRKLYLVLRKHFGDKTLLNRALKLSKKMYVPRKQSPLEHVMDWRVSPEQIERAVTKAPVYKLIKVLNAVSRNTATQDARYFKIRNGKSYLKVKKQQPMEVTEGFDRLRRSTTILGVIRDELKRRYGNWSDRVFYIPEGVDYAVPTSGKDFVGVMPYMSVYDFEGESVSLGVAWDTPADLDLHMMALNGQHYGWNGSYRGDVIYSGDMTHLNQYGYAAEFYKLSAGKVRSPMVVSVNDYYSDGPVKFDVFVTGANVDRHSKQGVATQIGPKSVLFHDTISPSDAQKMLMVALPAKRGFKIAFTSVSFGNASVPGVDDSMVKLIKIFQHQVENTFMMSDLIELLGGKIIRDEDDLKSLKQDLAERTRTTVMGSYVHVQFNAPEIIDLSPDKLTQSTFTDLLKEPEGDK